jgi:prepilin-type N-terminal cleavage/methylation domain-containing protein
MKKILKNAFTLVEMIVVITIIAVLATIGFTSFTGYNVQVRDSVRLSDIKTVYT